MTPALPAPGSVLRLPLASGQFGTALVIRSTTGEDPTLSTPKRPVVTTRVLVVSSAWVSDAADMPPQTELRQWLFLNHHAWRNMLQAHWISEPMPTAIGVVGTVPLGPENLALDTGTHGGWEHLAPQMLLQWRWDHDRDRLLAEEAAHQAEAAERSRLHAARQAEILRTTTWQSLSQRDWFTDWDDDGDAEPREQARALIKSFVDSLHALPKLTKPVVRRLLRECVNGLNAMQSASSPFQTTHSEDLDEALHLITTVARAPDLMDQVETWREW